MSTYLVSRLNTTIPLTLASLRTYYKAHVSQYDTIVSVSPGRSAQVSAFSAAEAKGESVAALAKQFSSDASAKKGGAYGCFAPSSSSLTACAPTWDAKLGTFDSTPST